MDATFIGLLQSQVNALQNNESDVDNNFVILETIKLLINNVNLADDCIDKYDKFMLRRLFASYGEIGRKVCSFYDSQEIRLDPVAQNGSIGKTILETSNQIVEIATAFDEMNEREAELMQRELELIELNKKYQEYASKVQELKNIAETVSDEVILALQQESQQLEHDIKSAKLLKENEEKKRNELKKVLEEFTTISTSINQEQRKIKTNLFSVIERNYSEIETLFNERNLSLEEMKNTIEKYISDFEKLDNAIIDYAATKAFYEQWLGENSLLVSNMRMYGVESIEELEESLMKTRENVKYELSAYDTLIKKIVVQEENARETIKKKQNKVV